jgi:uncharacterized protein YggE
MKRVLYLAGVISLLLVIIGLSGCDGFTSPPSRSSATGVSSQNTGIWVTGEGKVTVVPDVAILSVGVEAQADTVEQAQSDANGAMNNVKSELDARGIDTKDIKTKYFSIYPVRNYNPDKGGEELAGYRVTNMLTVKVRKVADTGAVIDAVARAGGNFIRIDSISFTVDDPVPYQKQAREKALADAKDKAKQIADKTGLNLGAPTYINETSSYYPYPVPAAYEAAVPMIGGSSSISPGETTITVYVQVAYGIK